MPAFENKSALITGASRGIGLEIARRLAAEGALVTIVGRNEARLQEAARGLAGCHMVAGDVQDPQTAARAVASAIEAHGSIDILINNAGGPPPGAPLVFTPIADFDSSIALNLRAPLAFAQESWRRSMSDRGGVIVNIASVCGLMLPRMMGAYSVAKAGLIHLTRALAAELGPKVRVNAIAPGIIETDATAMVNYDAFAQLLPAGRTGLPRDVAAAVLFLASEQASWITGETLVVDGGTLLQTGRLKPDWESAHLGKID